MFCISFLPLFLCTNYRKRRRLKTKKYCLWFNAYAVQKFSLVIFWRVIISMKNLSYKFERRRNTIPYNYWKLLILTNKVKHTVSEMIDCHSWLDTSAALMHRSFLFLYLYLTRIHEMNEINFDNVALHDGKEMKVLQNLNLTSDYEALTEIMNDWSKWDFQ